MKKYYLEETQTAVNLAKAFVGESQARNRYLFYSGVAKDEGYTSIQNVFLETSDNERGHGEMFYDYLTEGLPKITLTPRVLVPIEKKSTLENLKAAAEGENEEWTCLYPQFADIAEQEGFDAIATSFREIAAIEHHHDERFMDLYYRMKKGDLYEQCHCVTWQCANCGHRHVGKDAPCVCPACHHPQDYFSIVCDNPVI